MLSTMIHWLCVRRDLDSSFVLLYFLRTSFQFHISSPFRFCYLLWLRVSYALAERGRRRLSIWMDGQAWLLYCVWYILLMSMLL
ncbi:hypothetical protein V8F44DRAFT_636547 [Aspergillus fumigatus]